MSKSVSCSRALLTRLCPPLSILSRFRILHTWYHAFRGSILIVDCSLFIHLPYPCFSAATPSSRQRSNLSPPNWLAEIHKKLWRKGHLFGEIFRTANLTTVVSFVSIDSVTWGRWGRQNGDNGTSCTKKSWEWGICTPRQWRPLQISTWLENSVM